MGAALSVLDLYATVEPEADDGFIGTDVETPRCRRCGTTLDAPARLGYRPVRLDAGHCPACLGVFARQAQTAAALDAEAARWHQAAARLPVGVSVLRVIYLTRSWKARAEAAALVRLAVVAEGSPEA